MESINTEEVVDKLDVFQEIFGKLDEFDWWYMEIIQTDSGTQFTPKYFQEGIYVPRLKLSLVASEYQKMNGQVEVT